ncbi:thioredoxin fold domain-containing protein [Sulfurospirillum sp. 1612]|uniref:thioredoxin fold domain-containing protein n=1 Tax=Sulfurospirillum sp. 1612 TaxID=3094835 RepID=UPI002F954416
MKKNILGIVASALITCSLFASSTLPMKIQNEIKNLTFIKKAGFKILDIKAIGDTYAIKATHPKMPQATLFVSKDMKVVVIGAGFMNDSGQRISFPVDMKPYAKEAAYTYGNGAKNYYVFTDPECPFCQTFEKNLINLKKDATLHVFLYPLPFHKHAIAMSHYILSKKTSEERAKAIASIALGNTAYKTMTYSQAELKQFSTLLNRYKKIAETIGVKGTPSVYTQDGTAISWVSLLTKKPLK